MQGPEPSWLRKKGDQEDDGLKPLGKVAPPGERGHSHSHSHARAHGHQHTHDGKCCG